MVEVTFLETVKGLGDVYIARAPFDKQFPALQEKGIPHFISVRDDSYLRLQGNYQSGTRTCHAPICAKDSSVIVARISPAFENLEMARQMVNAHKILQYPVFSGRKIYGQWEKIAKKEKNKRPEERTAHVLSERGDYALHKDSDDAKFFFQDQRKRYFKEKVSSDSIQVYQIDPQVVDAQKGTIVNYTWFGSVGYGSDLGFRGRGLDCDIEALGVLTPKASAVLKPAKLVRKNFSPEEMKVPYTQKEITKQLEVAREVRKGNLPNSKLEELVTFLESLTQ
ncbi:MAG: hypothetical protein RL557_369 [archaeon]|jgi:hypothetical protein